MLVMTTKGPSAMDTGNKPLMRAMQDKRRSNAAGKHADRRTRRTRSRAAQRARAIREASA